MDRFQKRINEIEIAIIGESARWGDNVGVNIVKNETSIKIYPNPTRDYIHFDNVTDKDNVVIYNIEGQKVFNEYVNESLDLNSLNIKHGLYLLKVKNSTFKIMFN